MSAKELRTAVTRPQANCLFIMNPLTGRGLARLYGTHPPVEKRVRRPCNRQY